MSQEVRELKQIEMFNDYVAVFRVPVLQDTDLIIDDDTKKRLGNEGVVVGVGPDADNVNVGDCVIFRINRYHELNPQSGGYEGESVLIMRKMDLMVRKAPLDKYVVKSGE